MRIIKLERGSEICAKFDGLGINFEIKKHEIDKEFVYRYCILYTRLIKVSPKSAKKFFIKYFDAVRTSELGTISEFAQWKLLSESDRNLRVLLESDEYTKQILTACKKIMSLSTRYVMTLAEYTFYFCNQELYGKIICLLLDYSEFDDKTYVFKLIDHRIVLYTYISIIWKYGKEKAISMLIALIDSQYYDPKMYFFIEYINENGSRYVEIMHEVGKYFKIKNKKKWELVFGLLNPTLQAGINLLDM